MMPDQLAKAGSEHAHQVALFAWVAVARLYGFDVADEWSGRLREEVSEEEGREGAPAGHAPLPSRRADEPPVEPALEWFHAVPNGGARGNDKKSAMIRGAALRAEGVRSGVPDTFLPWPVGTWHGLYVEMKKPDQKPARSGRGGLGDDQLAFRDYARATGYGWAVCYSWREAAGVLRQYVEWGRR